MTGIPNEKAWMLTVGKEGDLNDLIFWLDDHPSEDDLAREAFDDHDRYRLMAWLKDVAGQFGSPSFIPVPLGIVRVLEMLVDDYTEAEAASGEDFGTYLTYSEG